MLQNIRQHRMLQRGRRQRRRRAVLESAWSRRFCASAALSGPAMSFSCPACTLSSAALAWAPAEAANAPCAVVPLLGKLSCICPLCNARLVALSNSMDRRRRVAVAFLRNREARVLSRPAVWRGGHGERPACSVAQCDGSRQLNRGVVEEICPVHCPRCSFLLVYWGEPWAGAHGMSVENVLCLLRAGERMFWPP